MKQQESGSKSSDINKWTKENYNLLKDRFFEYQDEAKLFEKAELPFRISFLEKKLGKDTGIAVSIGNSILVSNCKVRGTEASPRPEISVGYLEAMVKNLTTVHIAASIEDEVRIRKEASAASYSALTYKAIEYSHGEELSIINNSYEKIFKMMREESTAHLFVRGCVNYLLMPHLMWFSTRVARDCIEAALRARKRLVEVFPFVASSDIVSPPYGGKSMVLIGKGGSTSNEAGAISKALLTFPKIPTS